MDCNLCGKEIKRGERAVAVSYGNVYRVTERLEIIGDHFEYFHTDCFKPTWRKKIWIIAKHGHFKADKGILKVVDARYKVDNWLIDHPNIQFEIDEFEVE